MREWSNRKGDPNIEFQGFRFGTIVGLAFMVLFGISLLVIGCLIPNDKVLVNELLMSFGETLISVALITFVVESHSISNNYKKIRDYLLLDEPSFIERYNNDEVETILQLGIVRLVDLSSKKKMNKQLVNNLIRNNDFFLRSYIKQTAIALGENGFYCIYHRRKINVTPINNTEYIINITVELELENITSEQIDYEQEYSLYYITEPQIKSFKILSCKINDIEDDNVKKSLKKYSNTEPSTSSHPFNYSVKFTVPFSMRPSSKTHYVLNYEYKNFEQACYITYSLPFITRSFHEAYSLVDNGKFDTYSVYDYQIHASAYSPFKHQLESRNLVQRQNELTLTIDSNRWMLPGSGFVAIVRKKVNTSKEPDPISSNNSDSNIG